jgi:hypothetical protein
MCPEGAQACSPGLARSAEPREVSAGAKPIQPGKCPSGPHERFFSIQEPAGQIKQGKDIKEQEDPFDG